MLLRPKIESYRTIYKRGRVHWALLCNAQSHFCEETTVGERIGVGKR